MDVTIKRSKKKDKKFDAIIEGMMTVSFGAKGMSDYTKHKDAERKERYIARHGKKEDWNNPRRLDFMRRTSCGIKPVCKRPSAI
jgi:hypothetical protein